MICSTEDITYRKVSSPSRVLSSAIEAYSELFPELIELVKVWEKRTFEDLKAANKSDWLIKYNINEGILIDYLTDFFGDQIILPLTLNDSLFVGWKHHSNLKDPKQEIADLLIEKLFSVEPLRNQLIEETDKRKKDEAVIDKDFEDRKGYFQSDVGFFDTEEGKANKFTITDKYDFAK